MAFSDGDPFVSGSLYSFQQGNRMMQNYRGATVPSNLQDGALWSDSDDDRLWHQGAALDEVFTEKTTLTWENLLSNSGFGVWSQSDASKGIATITYDTGAKGAGSAPSIGDAVVGANGGTCKIISYTTASGTWAGGNAAGILTVGALSHDFAFVDNEVLTFGGVETAAVNMADSAVQVGLLQNGGFAADDDPPHGWEQGTGATITTEAGGKVGNCMKVAADGSGDRRAYQIFTTVIGKIYKASFYAKDSGTSSGDIKIGTTYNDDTYYNSGTISDAAWTLYTATFEATTTTTYISLTCITVNDYMLFDEVTAYEITPCCTAADVLCADGWSKNNEIDAYREHNGNNTKIGSFYSIRLINTHASGARGMTFPLNSIYDLEEWYQQFAGQTVTIGCWVKAKAASEIRLRIYDGSEHYSSYNAGASFEWLEFTTIVDDSITNFLAGVEMVAGADVYVSQLMLVFGSHIGEGNYAPKQQEIIYPETSINSNTLSAKSSLGDVAWTAINLEADTDGIIPKGVKQVVIYGSLKDSGSVGAAAYIRLKGDASIGVENRISCGGLTNDIGAYNPVLQPCSPGGDIEYMLEASGADTLDISYFRYMAIQVN